MTDGRFFVDAEKEEKLSKHFSCQFDRLENDRKRLRRSLCSEKSAIYANTYVHICTNSKLLQLRFTYNKRIIAGSNIGSGIE
jgi:hypothetical protein